MRGSDRLDAQFGDAASGGGGVLRDVGSPPSTFTCCVWKPALHSSTGPWSAGHALNSHRISHWTCWAVIEIIYLSPAYPRVARSYHLLAPAVQRSFIQSPEGGCQFRGVDLARWGLRAPIRGGHWPTLGVAVVPCTRCTVHDLGASHVTPDDLAAQHGYSFTSSGTRSPCVPGRRCVTEDSRRTRRSYFSAGWREAGRTALLPAHS